MWIKIKKNKLELTLLSFAYIFLNIIILNNNAFLYKILFLNTIFFIPFLIYFLNYDDFKSQKKFPYFEIIIFLLFFFYFFIFFFDFENFLFSFFSQGRVSDYILSDLEDKKNLIIDKMLEIYIYSILSLLISYYIFLKIFFKIKSSNIIFFKNSNNEILISYICFILFFILDLFSYFQNVKVISQIKTLLVFFSLLIMFNNQGNSYNAKIKYVLTFILYLYFLPKTFAMPLIAFTILILSIVWFMQKKINFIIILFFISFFYMIYETKNFHRQNLAKYNMETHLITFNENITIFSKFSAKKIIIPREYKKTNNLIIKNDQSFDEVGLTDDQYKSHVGGFVKRMAASSQTLAHLLYFEDIAEDYKGKTLKFAVYSLIPSIIWKDKPSFEFGNKFGRDFKFLSQKDFKTSINIPFIAELYLNYNYLGLIIGMSIFGFIISFIEFCISRVIHKDNILAFILISCTFSITYVDTSAIFVFSGLPIKIIFLLSFIYLINKSLILISKILNK